MSARFLLLALALFVATDEASVIAQNRVADGYKGIWYSSGKPAEYGYKFSGGPREWIVVRPKNNKWIFTRVCESTHNFDRGAIYITPSEWKIIGPTEPGPFRYGTGGEVAMWVSTDQGESWGKKIEITSQSRFNNSFVRKPLNPSKEFYALWADGNPTEFSRSSLYFTNESGTKVRILPYEMKRDFQRPAKVR